MMRKFTPAFSILTCLVFALYTSPVKAQILFSNGALVHVTTGAIMQVNGGFQDDNIIVGPGTWTNDGDMTITSNGSWPGNVHITNTAILQGNGKYHLDQDWINDAVFIDNNSTVDMYGNLKELITSTNGTITTFDTLMLRGTGTLANRRKQQTLDANVDHALILNDRVLFTAGHTMFIITPTLSAVTNTALYTKGLATEGLVSSIGAGSLSRMTNANSAYFFPVGADSIAQRYRKVLLTPATANPNTYTARLANNDASNDGDSIGLIDTSLCRVNPLFYHKINRTAGADNANIDIFYDASVDGIWTEMAQWNTPTANLWNNMGVVTYTAAVPYSDVLKNNWADFSNDPYILGNHKPIAPTLVCAPYCQNSSGTFTATADSGSYVWTVPAGDSIVSGNGTGSVVIAGNVTGPITVSTKLTGCGSSAASCAITIIPAPTIGFDTISSGMYNTNYVFTDTSKPAITGWYWNFGDGDSATGTPVGHQYPAAGTYFVTETVTNAAGCKASKTETVDVPEGIFIPNVFTPNGDGINDVFVISSSGIKVFSIEIFNRWGEKVFASTSAQISWDGRTSAGVKASDGDYYYILKATAYSGKDWSTHGYLQLIGSK
ncbi:MAG TPA: gliding motility-associated C-terminal domain-containing protein [Bacteroidia bacterium]|jgi:gliding motility-associated-like protein|nr:gliding motility-associated C-terminal domain-containing protein [Bacteroidia bacterium]